MTSIQIAGAAMPDWLMVLIGSLIAASPGVYAIIAGRQKIKAEASKIVTDTAVGLLAPLQTRIDRLETVITKLEAKVERLENENEELARQVREFRDLIRALWEGVLILTKQLDSHGIPTAWNVNQYRKLVERALGEPQA